MLLTYIHTRDQMHSSGECHPATSMIDPYFLEMLQQNTVIQGIKQFLRSDHQLHAHSS